VVGGVSGSGKSTIGLKIAGFIGAKFIDGDSLHPASNIAKMASGQPLNDDDREPWLDSIANILNENASTGIVVACSALKRKYRDRIVGIAPDAFFIVLNGSRQVLEQRLSARRGHFMPAALLDSQLAILERLDADEAGFEIDIASDPETLTTRVLEQINRP